ncbi:MAG: helix-turn-helix transcriptional regulator [Planctomycetes bacterium]|nr:helix-turn-helix transcriptional regulator [Planctomycetota bacterium]MCB9935805.1 helix-turn-helix transcriptional regulator [Planctomycetota bacterium]
MAAQKISAKEALLREVLERIADKWTLLVIEELDEKKPTRFSELRRRLGGVSQKMLTKTLRQLERDGLVTRTVHAEVPPRVEYRLTRLGYSLGEAVCSLWQWVEKHMNSLDRARKAFDLRGGAGGRRRVP